MRHHLKFLKHPSLIQFLLLLPIIGLYDLKEDLKRGSISVFTSSWIFYLFSTALWCLTVVTIICVICTFHIALLIPGAIILGIAFLLVGVPRIIYKLVNRKPRR